MKTVEKKKMSRVETLMQTSLKNMRAAMTGLSLEEFVRHNITELLALERAEYLDNIGSDKGNGYYSRSLKALMGNGIMINVPRTRQNGFSPIALELFKLSQEQVSEFCLALYTKGMTTRDIEDLMQSFFGNQISHTSISKLAEEFHGVRLAWERSPLDWHYRAIFCDAIFITVRRGDSYQKEPVYIAYGVNSEEKREILALAVYPTESAESWREVLMTAKKRGLERVDVLIADGLEGMPDVVHELFPGTHFQSCVVHKMRNVLRDIRPRDKEAVATDLKHVFDNFHLEATVGAAKQKLAIFLDAWKEKYPNLHRHFKNNNLDYYFSYVHFHPDVRRLIYTTNSIENVNRFIRKGTKNKLSFESPDRLLDYVFIIIKDFETRNWSRYPVHQFGFIHSAQTQ